LINYIWMFLMLTSILVGAFNGKLKEVTNAAIETAGFSVEIAIGLVGIMALWLGIMKIAEEAGMIRFISKIVYPVFKRIFPQIPNGHPALGSMMMNLSASFLGLGNAATPLGLKAMKELQEINPQKETASNSMVTFLAMNTACPVIFPASVIALRSSSGSTNPTAIIGTTLVASFCAFFTAILASKLLGKLSVFKIKEVENGTD